MALTEIQLPVSLLPNEKFEFYRVIQSTAGSISESMHRWKLVADFINRMEVADLDALTIPAGQIRADLINLKNLLNNLVSLWNNEQVTPSANPQTVVNALRKINQG